MPKNIHESINYIELPAKDFAAAQRFFSAVFNWTFTSYGENYLAFHDKTIEGGFFLSKQSARAATSSALIVFWSDDLETTQEKVIAHGGEISTDIFSFPGGRRFHFIDPNGNEFAVWTGT